MKLSVVIITLNEENNISGCIRSARDLSDDIIVVDAGSKDKTIELAQKENVIVFPIEWDSYGSSRNLGASLAKHDWILCLDADERVSKELADSILAANFDHPSFVYSFRRQNYIGNRKVRFGTMGADKVTRIYNRNFTKWDLSIVHEKLGSNGVTKKMIDGHVDHFCFKSFDDYRSKAEQYAQMSARKYFLEGRKAGLKTIFSPFFNSVKSYIFQLGFLEGIRGIQITRIIAYYSWLKYAHLQQLHDNKDNIATNYASGKIKTSTQTLGGGPV
ncbi:MAG: glycosyltransferase family 2 protein [Flavisolibacter sp.]